MNRRSFLALSPAFPVATVSVTLMLKQDGQPQVELDVAILKTQPGDCVILRTDGHIDQATAVRIRETWERAVPGTKAVVMDSGLKVDGVLRGPQ